MNALALGRPDAFESGSIAELSEPVAGTACSTSGSLRRFLRSWACPGVLLPETRSTSEIQR